MEILATNHSDILHTGFDDAINLGFFWILRSTKFIFNKVPQLHDELEVTTWPAGIDGLRILRRYEYKLNNEIIGEGFNTWVMCDTINRKLIVSNYYKDLINSMPIDTADYFKLGKVLTPKDMAFAYQKRIMNSDIDMNNHLNNIRYAEIIFNAIPHTILQKNDICEMQIDFMKECVLGDIIDLYTTKKDNIVYIHGKINEHITFRSKIVIKEIIH
jgi:acyl-ACP thioesterase